MQKDWKDEGLVLCRGGREQGQLWHCALSTPKSHRHRGGQRGDGDSEPM